MFRIFQYILKVLIKVSGLQKKIWPVVKKGERVELFVLQFDNDLALPLLLFSSASTNSSANPGANPPAEISNFAEDPTYKTKIPIFTRSEPIYASGFCTCPSTCLCQ